MSNRDVLIGSTFLYQSLYEINKLQVGKPEKEDTKYEPLKFKIFQNTHFYPLNQTIPLSLGDARCSFQVFHQKNHSTPRQEVLDIEHLSNLLYYTYGFSRYDIGSNVNWPFHRFVASARCFFPTELYLWLPQTAHIPPGIYHYDSLHHGLALIRSGDYRDIFSHAVDADLHECAGILLFSSLFWKTAFKYINFAYRLCTQEAGIIIGNALIVAGTMGFQSYVHYQFLDRVLNQLLGFTVDEESLLTMMPLYTAESKTGPNVQRLWINNSAQAMFEGIIPIKLEYTKTSSLNRELCTRLIELDQHTFLENTKEIVSDTIPGSTDCILTEDRITPTIPSTEPTELAQALHHRSSGDTNFTPLQIPITQEVFWEVVRYSLEVYSNDMCTVSSIPQLQLYIVVNNVESLDKGVYRFCVHCGMLHVIERNDLTMPFQAIQTQRNITTTSANILCFIVGNYEEASQLFGNRAYRILNIETGIVGHRISVMSAAHGLAARYSNSYEATQCRALLHLSNPSLVPLAELVIGYESPGIYAEERYRLSLRG